MEYNVYTFGGGEILSGVFNAIAMSINGQTGSLFIPLKHLGLILGTFWAALYAVYGHQIRVLTHWIVPMVVFMNLLFVPTATVWIHDPIHHYHQKVDHVPYGLAAFAGHVSTIGYHITSKIESYFSLPENLQYQKSGFLFGCDLIQKAKSFQITNSDLKENMRSFVGQCVLYDAMLGRKYSIDELRNADDIWELVSRHPSPARAFVWRDLKEGDQPRPRPQIITCSEGVTRFNHLWAIEINHSADLFGKKIFGKNGLINPRAELLQYLPLAYGQLGKIAKDATAIIKQQMMIYSIVDGIESNSTALGNHPNFAARRAYLQQRSVYETLGAMAGLTLPVMKAVLEAIIYAFFLFVIPLALLPFGYRYLLTWGQTVLWLQMWAPLYAILNYVMTVAATAKTLAALSISNPAGITLASSIGVTNANADIAAMAGYLAMSVPFLSLALVKGVGSFVHLASHLGNVSQSAASMAANEITSGNLSFGNISEGNRQISNSNMLNHSIAASYRNASMHLQSGRSEITTMADGSQIANIGTSNLPVSLNVAESQSAQLSEMASQSQQTAFNLSDSSSQHLSSSYRDLVDLSQTISQSENTSESVRQGVSTEQSQALHKGAQLISDFASQNNLQVQKAADMLAEASVGMGLGKNAAALSYKNSLSASDQEIFLKAEKLVEDQNFQTTTRQATQASKDIAQTTTDENTKRLATGVSGAYEQGISQRSEAAKSFRQAEDYANQANYTRANSTTINYNANQQFGEWLANQPADNTHGKIGTHGAAHIMASNPEQTMAYAQRFIAEKGLAPTHPVTSSPNHLKSSYEQEQGHQVYGMTQEPLQRVRQEAGEMAYSRHSHNNDKIAEQPEQTMPTQTFMAKQTLTTSTTTPESSNAEVYDKKVHNATKDTLSRETPEAGAGNLELGGGESIQQQVNAKMAQNQAEIDHGANQVQEKGNTITQKIKKHQSKGVNYKVVAKGAKEVGNMAKDVKHLRTGETQQK